MTSAAPPDAATTRDVSLVAVIASISVVGVTFGITTPLLSMLMEGMGASRTIIGFNAAMPAVAAILLAPVLPRLIARTGQRPFMLMALAGVLATLVAFPLWPSIPAWFVIRFLMGAAATALFIVSETWINQLATERTRGRVIAVYSTVLSLGLVIGALVLPVTGIEGWAPFLAAAGMTALAGIPLVFAGRQMAPMAAHEAGDVLRYVRAAPDAIGAAFLMGVLYFGIFSLLPLYGLALGFDTASAARMVAVAGSGLVVCPLLVGWLADRMDRARLLRVLVISMVVSALLLPSAMGVMLPRSALLFIIGGGLIGLYTLGLTLLGQRFQGGRLAAANGAFVLMFGVGEMVGPPVMGAVMDLLPPHGFAWAVAGVCAAYGVLLMICRPGTPALTRAGA